MTRTAYDVIAYPTGVIPSTHPDRLATIARLHGLSPAPIETARVLEIGGGDGMNVIALATAYPHAHFVSFDLAADPVRRGAALVAMAGLTNVEVRTGDILVEAETLDGPFDYVLAHGVYAWVPSVVRPAMMALIGRVLAPQGVAFVSYNALPGGHLRQALREMALYHVEGIEDPVRRLEEGWRFLAAYSEPRDPDYPGVASLRAEARLICRKRPEVLHHDELGDWFAPQALKDVVATANAHGLAFLNDAQPPSLDDGLLPYDVDVPRTDQAAIVRRAQTRDYAQMRFFRQTLLVRDTVDPARRLPPHIVRDLWLSSAARQTGPSSFELDTGSFDVGDVTLAQAIAAAAAARPGRVPIAELVTADDEDRLRAFVELYKAGAVGLHSADFPAATASARPLASPLARLVVESGQDAVVSLDHQMVHLAEPAMRAFLLLLDGTRDLDTLDRDWRATEHAGEVDTQTALRSMVLAGLLRD